jgi:hypothetical protein
MKLTAKLVDKLFPGVRQAAFDNGSCVCCCKTVTAFRDALSKREWEISMLCQECQDTVFGGEPT